jgi:hypothetical protein
MFGFEPGTIIVLSIGILGIACTVHRKLKSDFAGLKPPPKFLSLFDR